MGRISRSQKLILAFFGAIAAAQSALAANGISALNQQRLSSLRDSVRGWVRTCDGAMDYGVGCDQGDLALFAGLLCLSGETDRCQDVQRSQAADGSWWRAPRRIGETGQPVFSRDQTMGVLAYLAATRDQARAQRWVDWVASNGQRWPDFSHVAQEDALGFGFFSVCKGDFHVNCLLMPPLWGLIGRVWQWIGLQPNSSMRGGQALDEDEGALLGETKLPQKPYERHLAATDVFLRRMIGRHDIAVTQAAATLSKDEPNNAFFRFLSDGPTNAVAELALAQCPDEPLVSSPGDWLWMADNPPAEPFRTSMGWDCIFMANLLLNETLQGQMGF